MAELGDYIQEYSARNKNGDNIPVYSVTNDRGFCTDYFSKEVASKDQTTYKVVPKGYFAYNPSRINVGSIDWQDCEDKVIVSPLYIVFSTAPQLDNQYLLYYLKSDIGQTYIRRFAEGSVRDSLKYSGLVKLPIRIAPLQEQQHIAATLDKLTDLISLRKQQLTKLDELVKSRFIEWFNSGDYPLVKASEVCDFITKGTTPSASDILKEPKIDSVPFIKVYNLSFNGEMLFQEEPQYISRDIHKGKLARSIVYPDDVLMNIVGPPLGKFAYVTNEYPEWNINQAIAIFRVKERILPRFLLYSLMQPRVLKPFLEQAVGVRQLNLSLEQCRNLEFPLPPINQQAEFVAFVCQADKSKLAVQKSLDELEILKKSLMQKYFG